MEWLTQFDAARTRGSHAFLFTGNVGDAFPPAPQPEDAPVDALWAWAEIVERWVRENVAEKAEKNDGRLIWTFDPVHGFTFRSSEDEQAFRRLAGITTAAPAQNPIARAAAGVADVLPLPNDPLVAMHVMRRVLNDASNSSASTRCVVILPHADVLCPAGVVTNAAASSALVALALLQIASSDALRRAGHLVLLAAPTAASVDEQLRRTDGPITTIAVGKPMDAERAAFVDRCCSWEIFECQKRCNDAYAERTAFVDAERARIGERMDALRAERAAHAATRERVLAQDTAYQRALRARDAAKEAYDRAFAEHNHGAAARREDLLREDAQLDAQLNAADSSLGDAACRSTFGVARDSALACERLDADVWQRIRGGDAVRLVFRDGHHEDVSVLVRHRNGRCNLALPSQPTEPIAWGGAHVADFVWQDGAVTAINGRSGQIHPMPLPDGCVGITRAPAARRALEARRAAIATEIAALEAPNGTGEPRKLRKCREALADAERAVGSAEAKAVEQWENWAQTLSAEFALLEASDRDPTTPEIAALNERISSLERSRDTAQKRGMLPIPQMGREHFVRATQGLGYRDIAALLRDPALDAATIATRRLALLQRAYGHLLDVVEPQYGFEGLAGLDHVKRVLSSARDAMLRGDRKAVPQGIFLMGPPGTGKTAIAHAFARECGMLLVRMRNLRNMFVGNSEQRVEEVCQALLDLAPCVCFRDETDQEDSGRDAYQGDSGVSARIRKRFMEFEADERIRGRVLFVKATNRPDLVDAAMKRDGRADERIVVITGDAEYAGLFPTYVRREGFPCAVTDFASFVTLVRERGFSGAGVLNICRRAYQFGSGTITEQSLRDAIADTMPSADRVADARMTLAAVAAANSLRSLPDGIDRIVAEAQAVLRDAKPEHPADASMRRLFDAVENAAIVEATKGQKAS